MASGRSGAPGGAGTGGRAGRVVVVGSLNLDHTVRVSRLPRRGETVVGADHLTSAGGKGLNQAVAAARQGATVAIVGAVGDDQPGSLLAGVLEDEGVACEGLLRLPGPSGTALVTVSGGGDNTVVVAPGANAGLRPQDVAPAVVAGADVLLCQMEIPAETVRAALEAGRAVGALTVLNPSPATGPLPASLLRLADVVLPNETEARALVRRATGTPREVAAAAGEALVASGAGTAVVTLGALGALVVGATGSSEVSPFAVPVVDPTAAGDAFAGAFAAALAAGEPVLLAARRGAAAGALAVAAAGAVPSLPDRAAVDGLLGRDHRRSAVRLSAGSRPRSPSAGAPPAGPRRPPRRGAPGGAPGGPPRPA